LGFGARSMALCSMALCSMVLREVAICGYM